MEAKYIKRCGFLTKREDLSTAEFLTHWQNVHAALCQKVPGLKRYAINFVDREQYPKLPYDGFSELWFESQSSYDAGMASPEGRALMADLPNFTATISGVLVTECRYLWPEDDGL